MFFDFMKYSEFYKLIESAGWTIKKGKKHYKYVHGTLDSMLKKAGLKK